MPRESGHMERCSEIAKLIIMKGMNPEVYCITSPPVTLGRAPESDFRISAEGVSRLHSRIDMRRSDYFISDLGSTNGTFVNGKRVETETKLSHGDMVELGKAIALRFEI